MPYWIDCSIFSQSGKTCPWLVLLGRQFTGFENNNSNENIGNEGDDWCQWFWFERESAALCLIQIGTVDWLAGRRCRRSGEVFYSSKADWKRTLCIICIQGTFSLLPPQGGDWGGAYCLSSISHFAFFQIHISGFSRTKVFCNWIFLFDAIKYKSATACSKVGLASGAKDNSSEAHFFATSPKPRWIDSHFYDVSRKNVRIQFFFETFDCFNIEICFNIETGKW